MDNERFQLFKHKDKDYILDNPNTNLDFIEMLGDALTSEELVSILNNLNNENISLKNSDDLTECETQHMKYREKVHSVLQKNYNKFNDHVKKNYGDMYTSTVAEIIKRIAKELEVDLEIDNNSADCGNCVYLNSLFDWSEGAFYQCILGNKLWLKCNDYKEK